MTAQLRPLGNKVFVLRDGKETTSAGGIVVSENTVGKSSMGTVVFSGPGKQLERGGFRETAAKPGDRVLFDKHSGTEISVEGQELLVLSDDNIIAILED